MSQVKGSPYLWQFPLNSDRFCFNLQNYHFYTSKWYVCIYVSSSSLFEPSHFQSKTGYCEDTVWTVNPPIYLNSIFAIFQVKISSLTNLIFTLFQTWILQATAGRKMQFKLGKKSISSNWIFQTGECQKFLKSQCR